MCEVDTTASDIEAFVQLLGRVRIPLETVFREEMERMEREANAWNRDDERTSGEYC